MIAKLRAFYAVFTAGQSVANPAIYKHLQLLVNAIIALLSALVVLAKSFGYDIHITDDQLSQLGSAVLIIAGLFNGGVTVASTDKIGLPALKDSASQPSVPEVSKPVQPAVPLFGGLVHAAEPAINHDNERRAANGDLLGDTTPRNI